MDHVWFTQSPELPVHEIWNNCQIHNDRPHNDGSRLREASRLLLIDVMVQQDIVFVVQKSKIETIPSAAPYIMKVPLLLGP